MAPVFISQRFPIRYPTMLTSLCTRHKSLCTSSPKLPPPSITPAPEPFLTFSCRLKVAMSPSRSFKGGSSVVVQQTSSRLSTYTGSSPASRPSTYSSTTVSMDASNSSQPAIDARYRSGSSGESSPPAPRCPLMTDEIIAGFYTDIKEVPHPRGGRNVVVVNHNRSNPDKDELRSSDYQYSRSSHGTK